MNIYEVEHRKCPKCGGRLSYGEDENIDGDSATYSVYCSECDWEGYEQNRIVFEYYFDNDDKN